MMRYEFWLAGTIFTLSLGLKVYIVVLLCNGIGEAQTNKQILIVHRDKKRNSRSSDDEQLKNKNVFDNNDTICKCDDNKKCIEYDVL